jgi:hypothetical protein
LHDWDVARSISISPDGATAYIGGDGAAKDTSDYVTLALSTSTGAVKWINVFSRSPGSVEIFAGLVIGPGGSRVFLTGATEGNGGFDFGTVALDADTGKTVWARFYDGPGDFSNDVAEAVAVSPDGSEVIVTGYSDPTANVDFATVAYSTAAAGHVQWVHRYDGGGFEFPKALTVSPNGAHVFVTGWSSVSGEGDDYATVGYALPSGREAGIRFFDGPAHDDDRALAIASTPALLFVTGPSFGGIETDDDYATVAYRL